MQVCVLNCSCVHTGFVSLQGVCISTRAWLYVYLDDAGSLLQICHDGEGKARQDKTRQAKGKKGKARERKARQGKRR